MSRQIPQYLFEGGGTGAIKEVEKLFNLRGVNGKSSLTGDVKFAQKFARDYLESAPYDFSLLRPFLPFSLPILSLSPSSPSLPHFSFFLLVEHVDESVHRGVSFAKLVPSCYNIVLG